jgi:hypothetical protein
MNPHEAVHAIIDLIGKRIPLLTSAPDFVDRLFAAGGLARCRALLMGVHTLNESGLADVGGALVRPLHEMWATSLYALYGGRSAVESIAAEYSRRARQIRDAIPLDLEVPEAPEGAKPMPFEHVCREVVRMLKEGGDDHAEDSMNAYYDLVFRAESLLNVHPAGGMTGHVEAKEGLLVTVPHRREPDGGEGRLLASAVLTGHLASHVFEHFGVANEDLHELIERLRPAAL